MKNLFTLLFVVTFTTLFSQQCYKSSDNKNVLIFDNDHLYYFDGNVIFEKYTTNSKGNYLWTSKKDLSFKIKNKQQINVLGSILIKSISLYKYDCNEDNLSVFQSLR